MQSFRVPTTAMAMRGAAPAPAPASPAAATLVNRIQITSVPGSRQLRLGGGDAAAAPILRAGYSSHGVGAGCGPFGQKEHLSGGASLRLLESSVGGGREGWGIGGCPARAPARAPGLKVEAAKRVNSGRRFALSSTLVVAKGNEDKATALCKDILKWGTDKTMQKGSGVTAFDCNLDPFETNTYHFWELYDSFQVMNDVRSSPEHTKFMDNVRPLLEEPVGLAAYEYKDGQIGHMLNPIGPKGEGGLDDATGQSGTKQQSSVIGQGLGEMEEDIGSKAWGLEKLLAKVRGESKDGGWSFKSLFGDSSSKAKK